MNSKFVYTLRINHDESLKLSADLLRDYENRVAHLNQHGIIADNVGAAKEIASIKLDIPIYMLSMLSGTRITD